MIQTKIDGRFYPLIPEVARKLREAKLTAAEWRIWSYLIEHDPWGDRYIDFQVLDVMAQCDCSKATVYRAIAKFQQLELFDFQDKGFSYKNETGASKLRKGYLKNETTVSEMRQVSQICDKFLKNETTVSEMRQPSQICENQPPEPAPAKESETSQTRKTYLDLNTLSEDERESFKAFCKRKADQLPTRVVLLDSWIKKHFKELHAEYQLVYGDKSSARSKPSITKGKNWEKVNAAMKTGELKDTYYSDLYKCDCVVLLNGTVIPLEEWVNAAGRKN